MPGLESVAWSEIKRRLPSVRRPSLRVVPRRNGLVAFSYEGPPTDLLALRTVEDLFVTLAQVEVPWGYAGLSSVYEALLRGRSYDSALATYRLVTGRRIPRRVGFRVIARMASKDPPYRRLDLQRSVEKAISKHGHANWVAVRQGETVEIWANVIGRELICGLRLSDASMRHREYQVSHLPASLRPSVAAAMVLLSEPERDELFMDAMCGAGTIVIERALAERHALLIGGDIETRALEAAAANIGPKHKPRQLLRWDARRLPLARASVDKVATNLPFGKQMGSPKRLRSLYAGFVRELDRVLTSDGRAVLLSSETRLLVQCVDQVSGLVVAHRRRVDLLGQAATIHTITRA